MRKLSILLLLLYYIVILSCSSDDSETQKEITQTSPELLKLEIEFESKIYTTNINNSVINLNQLLPFYAHQVEVKTIQLSLNSTSNIKNGDLINLSSNPVIIEVTSQNGDVKKDYELNLDVDLGLQISVNHNIEKSSSYNLQTSNVYVDANQLTKNFELFFQHAYADFNQDGYTDVLLSAGRFQSYDYSPIYLYHGNGNGVNSEYCECGGECSNYECRSFLLVDNILPNEFKGMQHPRKILTGDYNHDGLIDAFIIGHGYDANPFPGESPIILFNDEGKKFEGKKLNNIKGFYHGGSSADFDNDGDLDIFLIGSPSESNAIILLNDGQGNFTISTDYFPKSLKQSGGYYTTEFIDIDKDGYIDLLVAGHELENAPTTIFWGNITGTYFENWSTQLSSIPNFEIIIDIDATDIDKDGDNDIIISRVSTDEGIYNFYERHYIQIIENKGDKQFQDKTNDRITNYTGLGWRVWIQLIELDNDNDIDIYYQGDHNGNEKWLNDGNGVFTKIF